MYLIKQKVKGKRRAREKKLVFSQRNKDVICEFGFFSLFVDFLDEIARRATGK